jgi:hypothetical protein
MATNIVTCTSTIVSSTVVSSTAVTALGSRLRLHFVQVILQRVAVITRGLVIPREPSQCGSAAVHALLVV